LESAHIDMLIFVIAIRRFDQFAKSSAQLGFPELHRQRRFVIVALQWDAAWTPRPARFTHAVQMSTRNPPATTRG
jgi:hypothetical protein